MDRRVFLASVGSAPLLSVNPAAMAEEQALRNQARELKADVVILGGGMGGIAAALGALRNGKSVILTEETDWIGGQVTQQGVPPDEHPWIEEFGATASYHAYRKAIRDYYRRRYPLTEEARAMPNLDPGNSSVSRITHEPRVTLAVYYEMLNPYISTRQLSLLLEHKVVSAQVEGDRVESVRVIDLRSGNHLLLTAPYFIDATELGDLLPLTGTEYITGAESKEATGELHAHPTGDPANMQACTWCFAMDYIDGEDHTIDKPEQYDFWRDYTPDLTPPWPGKLLAWPYTSPPTGEPQTNFDCDPIRESGDFTGFGFWRYRRIAHALNFEPGTYRSDITIVNWPHNDYMLGNLFDVSAAERERHWKGAQQLSLSLLYWMQTEAPRRDGGTGWPGLRLRGDLLGTETSHGLAKHPYVREARRIEAEFTVLEQHVGTEMRMEETGLSRDEIRATEFHDTVGIGCYRIDLHPSTAGVNYNDFSSLPFQIPLGALIPKRMENLLPANKNIGTTHITNGCYRLHPVEWNIGEAAGTLAAYCIDHGEIPRGVRNTRSKLEDFQRLLENQGFELSWPQGVTPR